MNRLDEKAELINSVLTIYANMSRFTGVYNPKSKDSAGGNRDYCGCVPRKLRKVADKSILKDFIKGLKIINKKNPIYQEMPKLKDVLKEQSEVVIDNSDCSVVLSNRNINPS